MSIMHRSAHARTVIISVFVIGLTSFFLHWTNDIQSTQRSFKKMLKSVNKHNQESLAASALKTQKALSYFTRDAYIDPGETIRRFDKTELKVIMMHGRKQVDSLNVKALGFESRKSSPNRIEMDVTLDGTITKNGYSEQALGTYRAEWTATNGNWLIQAIYPLEVVKHPSGIKGFL